MAELRIRLLGAPEIHDLNGRRSLQGRKSWALLAYLLLEGRPLSRHELAEMLFSEANDPLAALRWQLVRVRRALAPEATVVEAQARLTIAPRTALRIDTDEVLHGYLSPDSASASGELLAGLRLEDVEPFAWWLGLTRSRLRSALGDALRRSAAIQSATKPNDALALAERAVRLDPFDDRGHELVVRLLVDRADIDGARAYADLVEQRYRAELGVEPGPGLRRPLEILGRARGNPLIDRRLAARSGLDWARARFDSGDYEAALSRGRRAATDAEISGDPALEASALVLLATILAHSLRGRDDEAGGLLDRALGLATAAGDAALVAEVERERAYLGLIAGEYGGAEAAAHRSIELARGVGRPTIEAVSAVWLGACQLDRGEPAASATFTAALEAMGRGGDHRWRGYTEAWRSRAALESGDPPAAVELAKTAVVLTRQAGWIAVLPWSMISLGDAQLATDADPAAEATYAEALALGEEMGDPCWESLSLRGLARLALRAGARDRAVKLLVDALHRTHRYSDVYKWAEAVIATDLVEIEHGRDLDHVRTATRLVIKGPMTPLAARLRSIIGRLPEV